MKPPLAADAFDRLCAGDIAALARAITSIESEADGSETILRAVHLAAKSANVVGFTGPPGAGKSSLISAVIRELRGRGKTVAIVAVDPSSPITGGAILGDRIRMVEHVSDPGVFARSLGSRGHLGGVSRTTRRIVELLRCVPFDVVIVETVGTGQSEVEITTIADVKLMVNAPGLGDDIQAIKAGILEIADIMVVNKSDLPGASRTVRHLQMMLALRATNRDVPVLATSALQSTGIAELVDTLQSTLQARQVAPAADRTADVRQIIADQVAHEVRKRLRTSRSSEIDAICKAFIAGEIGFSGVTDAVLSVIGPHHNNKATA
jgi:LAO/AO transport system kinase